MPSEPQPNERTITRASYSLDMPGYLVDREALVKIDGIARDLLDGPGEIMATFELRVLRPSSKSQAFSCKDLGALLSRMETEAAHVENLSLRYAKGKSLGISTVFDSEGTVETKGFSHASDFDFDLDRLVREIRECDQQYTWAVKRLVYRSTLRLFVAIVLVLSSLALLANIGFYFYARGIGVNVDPSIIPAGETLTKRVEEVLKTDDLGQKLNVLLMAQLKDFTNISDILAFEKEVITSLLIVVVVTTLFSSILSIFSRLYPRAFFHFGSQEKVWSRLQHRREVWGIVIVIGFLVNLAAGLVIAILIK